MYKEQAIRIREKILSSNHPELAQSYYNLAWLYFKKGRGQEAVEYMQMAINIFQKNFPGGHPHLTNSGSGKDVMLLK